MTVASEACGPTILSWTGVQTSFSAGFPALDPSHVQVYYTPTGGTAVLLTAGVHYNATLAPGSLLVTVAPVAMPAAPGAVSIRRQTPATQGTDFANLAAYAPGVHTLLHDSAAYRDAELRRDIAAAVLGDPTLGALASRIGNDSVVPGTTVKDALQTLIFSVTGSGADSTGVTNAAARINADIAAAVANGIGNGGARFKLLHGKYKCDGTPIVVDLSGISTRFQGRIILEGEGAATTISNLTGSIGFQFIGSAANPEACFELRNIRFVGGGVANSRGVVLQSGAYCKLDGVFVEGFDLGFDATDVDQSMIANSNFRFNNGGVRFNAGITTTDPNSITLQNCAVSNNAHYGLQVQNANAFLMSGGTVQYNGTITGGAQQYGAFFADTGSGYGNILFSGVAFEGNGGAGDFVSQQTGAGAQHCNFTFDTCAFARTALFAGVGYGTNQVSILGNQPGANYKFENCNFWGFSPYTASAGRPAIANANPNARIEVDGLTKFWSALEAPTSSQLFTGEAGARDGYLVMGFAGGGFGILAPPQGATSSLNWEMPATGGVLALAGADSAPPAWLAAEFADPPMYQRNWARDRYYYAGRSYLSIAEFNLAANVAGDVTHGGVFGMNRIFAENFAHGVGDFLPSRGATVSAPSGKLLVTNGVGADYGAAKYPLATVSGLVYRLDFSIAKISGLSGRALVRNGNDPDIGTLLATSASHTSTDRAYYTVTFTATSTLSYITFGNDNSAPGETIEIRDVELFAIRGSVPWGVPPLLDQSFAAGIGDWRGSRGGVVTASGNRMRITNGSADFGAAKLPFATVAGQAYRADYTLRRVSGTGASLVVRNGNDSELGTLLANGPNITATADRHASTDFTAASALTWLVLSNGNSIAGDTIEVTDFKVYPVLTNAPAAGGRVRVSGITGASATPDQTLWQIDDGTENNRARIAWSGGHIYVLTTSGGAGQSFIDLGAVATNTPLTVEMTWSTDGVFGRLNGGFWEGDATAVLPVNAFLIRFGVSAAGGFPWSGTITDEAYWPGYGFALENATYRSSIDGGTYGALKVQLTYPVAAAAKDLPILVMMHGFSENIGSFGTGKVPAYRYAAAGFLVALVGMRGNDTPALSDAGGREIYDIIDAVDFIRANYPQASKTRAMIAGYSGGGGNTLSCAMRCPDLFAGYASHFGPSDYTLWYNEGAFAADLVTRIGDTPTNVPAKYQARKSAEGIPTNLIGGHLWLFHDKQDSAVPVVHSDNVATAMIAAGNTRYTLNETDTGDPVRWLHGDPYVDFTVRYTEKLWLEEFRKLPDWTYPKQGTVRVHGWLKTKRFEVRLGSMEDATATLTYDTDAGTYLVTPVAPSTVAVTITQGGRSASATISGATTLNVIPATLTGAAATFLATPSSANLRALLTDESGTGAALFAGGALGAATATSINGNTLTPGTWTLTGGAGKTLTFNNSIALSGTDGTVMMLPSTSATLARTDAAQTFAGVQTFSLTIAGSINGNAATATTATTATNATNSAITDDTTTNATMDLVWATSNTGNLPLKVTSTKLTFNPSTGVLSSTSFTGAGTGLTGTAASLTAGTATNAVNSAITDDTTTNATMDVVWVTSNTGNLPHKVSSTKLNFNPSTGILAATGFAAAGSILSSSATAGVGYAAGAGGSVSQATSRVTGVTLNKICGQITLFSQVNSAVSQATAQAFTVANSTVAQADVVHVSQQSGTDRYMIFVTKTQAGSFEIAFFAISGTTNEAPVFNFQVIKSVIV